MDDEVKINLDVSKGHLILALIFLFFVGGLVIGVLAGGAYMNNQWKEYHADYEERIQNQCTCTDIAGKFPSLTSFT